MENELRRGGPLTLELASDEPVTEVVLMGTNATTHFMESGTARMARHCRWRSQVRVRAKD